ncbi:hypothetical protein SEA_HONK_56 [Microbacterium phage Honk]|uniref:Uncharacterized protein n=1 Tax=Microbacterium phage Honk TaxID=2836095 RepID=A0A8F3INX4_9CAUD|nr:hypothetical protein SEA_HONK_56 [Microbacterium phage Honk]
MTNTDKLIARIDRVHAHIARNPHERAELAPHLRELEEKLLKAL